MPLLRVSYARCLIRTYRLLPVAASIHSAQPFRTCPLSQLRPGTRLRLFQNVRHQSNVSAQTEIQVPLSNPEVEVIAPHTLRPYQLDCIETCIRLRQEGEKRQLVSLPVGSGKTVVMSHLIERLAEPRPGANRVLVLAHRQELLKQAKEQIERCSPHLKVEIEMAEMVASGEADVTCASIATLGRQGALRLNKFDPKQFKMIIIDEAHHAFCVSYQRILQHFGVLEADSDILLWGCTATVNRHDGISLDTFTYISYHKDFLQMIEENWLCRLRITTVLTSVDLDDVKKQNGDFNLQELSKATNTPFRNQIVVKSYKDYAAGRLSTLVFAATVEHVKDLTREFQQAGIDARYVTGTTDSDERRSTLLAFQNREFPVLVNCGVYTEGTDLPSTDCVLMARPTRSEVLFLQMIGRGMRLHPDKADCLVLDFVDAFRGKSLVTIPSIMGLKSDVAVDGEELLADCNGREQIAGDEEPPRKVLSTEEAKIFVSVSEYDDASSMYEQIDAIRVHEIGLKNFSQQTHLREISSSNWVEVDDDVFILGFHHRGDHHATFRLRKIDGVYHADYKERRDHRYTEISFQNVKSLRLAIIASETFIQNKFGRHALIGYARYRKKMPTKVQMSYLKKRVPKQLIKDINRGAASDLITKAQHGWVGRAKKYSRKVLSDEKKEEMVKLKRKVTVGRILPKPKKVEKTKDDHQIKKLPKTDAMVGRIQQTEDGYRIKELRAVNMDEPVKKVSPAKKKIH